jgi:hypothetical protein
MLASLVVLLSPVSDAIERARDRGVFISMYFDDFIGSALDIKLLEEVFVDLQIACDKAALPINGDKLAPPAESGNAFNCALREGNASVTLERVETFFAETRSAPSIASFEAYFDQVASRNR